MADKKMDPTDTGPAGPGEDQKARQEQVKREAEGRGAGEDQKLAPGDEGVQKVADEVAEQGYFGTREPAHPDEAYALTSGPEAPSGDKGPE
jgi:hypothetical protein